MTRIPEFLQRVAVGEALSHGGLGAVRLGLGDRAGCGAPRVEPLGEALRHGLARVVEKGDGEVGQLVVESRNGSVIFGLAGEVVVGGRQDRVLNQSVLIAPGRTVEVGVSCVEQHRWEAGGARRSFRSADYTANTRVRSVVTGTVVGSVLEGGAARADQRGVWRAVAGTLGRTGGRTRTGALAGGFVRQRELIEAFVRAFPAGERQVGLAFFTDRFAGLDCFGDPGLFEHYAARLVRGAALDAGDEEGGEPLAPRFLVEDLLGRLRGGAPRVSRPGAGDGVEHHYDLEGAVATVLTLEGWPVHLVVTPGMSGGAGDGDGSGVGPGGAGGLGGDGAGARDPRGMGRQLARRGAGDACRLDIPCIREPERVGRPQRGVPVGDAGVVALRVRGRGLAARSFRLVAGTYLVGRSRECDVHVPEEHVSARHARLDVAAGRIALRDLGSTNGTRVNGVQVLYAELHRGDVLRLGCDVYVDVQEVGR